MAIADDIYEAIIAALDPEVVDLEHAPASVEMIGAIASGVAAALPDAVLLQVVSGVDSSQVTVSGSSFATKATPAVAITTQRANSRIRVTVRGLRAENTNSNHSAYIVFSIGRSVAGGSSVVNVSGKSYGLFSERILASGHITACFGLIDAPGLPAGSVITYRVSAYRPGSININVGSADMVCELIVEELAP